MSHRHDPNARPLIDQIPDNLHDDSLSVSSEGSEFYYGEEDAFIVHPYWRALITKTSNRVPRRIQRYFLIYFALLFIFWVCWRNFLEPKYEAHRLFIEEMDADPKDRFGLNMRPQFKDMVMVKDLDEKHLPKHKKRLVFVGDVHGCKAELEALLAKLSFDTEHDHLILTGDIIAKGPDSPGVVTFAEQIGASCVRGNHEDKVLLSYAEMESYNIPLKGSNGEPNSNDDTSGKESVTHGDAKTRKLAKQFSKQNIQWLRSCPVILRVGNVHGVGEMVVVHAGLVPGVPLERQDPFQCMNMRTIDLETQIPSEGRDHTPWDQFWNHRQKKQPEAERVTVVYGHDRKKGLNIQEYSKGLDSGCVSGGRLTALVIDKDGKQKYVDVKCKGYTG